MAVLSGLTTEVLWKKFDETLLSVSCFFRILLVLFCILCIWLCVLYASINFVYYVFLMLYLFSYYYYVPF